MQFKTSQIISMTEANQNFSKVVKVADQQGAALIFKNNKPRYLITVFEDTLESPFYEDVLFFLVAKDILSKHLHAFKELAK